jgi:leader peptidase (prepilin peptidase)/N-methyltransferase
MMLPWILAGAATGLAAGPRIRAAVFSRSTEPGEPPRAACPSCDREIVSARRRWRSVLPVTGRCPACRERIGPYPLAVELAAAVALSVLAARSTFAWEAGALAWLALAAVPLAFIDLAVRRLPDPLTAAAFAGTAVLLAVAALASGEAGLLGRAGMAAAAMAGLYLVITLAWPGGMGLGDVKLAASVGGALGWMGWRPLGDGAFLAFLLAAAWIGVLRVTRGADHARTIPMGPFILLGALAAIAA